MLKLVVLSSVLALAASSAIAPLGLGLGGIHGLGLGGIHGLGLGWAGHLGAPLAAPLAAPYGHIGGPIALGAPVHGAYNYRGPLSLAPGQPANILAADGRPLDTLSVNLDRAAHLTARAVDSHGLHLLKKRSAPLLAPAAWSHTARIDVPTRLISHAPLAVAAPLHAPIAPLAAPVAWRAPIGLGVGPWGHGAALGPWGHGAGLGHLW